MEIKFTSISCNLKSFWEQNGWYTCLMFCFEVLHLIYLNTELCDYPRNDCYIIKRYILTDLTM